jgi:ATP-binding cassette, subfamily C, bacterial CydD
METDLLLSTARPSTLGAEVKLALAGLLVPGRRSLRAAGVLDSVAYAATAGVFFTVAAMAQDVFDRDLNWGRDLRWLAMLAGAAAVRAGASYLAAGRALDGALAVESQLRSRLLERLMAGAGGSLSGAAQATAVIDEVERVGAYAQRYQPARVAAVVVPVVLLVVVFPLSWPVGLLLVVCLPLPPLNLSIVGMGTADVARRHGEELRYLSGYFLDRLRGLPTLRALDAEAGELGRIRAASQRLSAASMAVLRVAFLSAAVLEAIVTLSVAVVAMYVGLTLLGYVHVPGLPSHLSLGTGLFLLMVTPLYFQPMRALATAYHERADALAATEALAPLLAADHPTAEHTIGRHLLSRPPQIEVNGLGVVFADREQPALDGVSLAIRPGELVGVTGASGAGKSTLLRVLAGDLEPTDVESVLVDGAPVGVIARPEITWLGQRPHLFAGSLADNIALGQLDANEAELVEAALAAGLGPLLERLPLGLQTPMGDAGWGLSGGEVHRVALARTFVKRARLLLFDKPTAHLDAASESEIVEVIRKLARGATTVVATHSPALLAACDRVVELDRGRLVPAPVGALVGSVSLVGAVS